LGERLRVDGARRSAGRRTFAFEAGSAVRADGTAVKGRLRTNPANGQGDARRSEHIAAVAHRRQVGAAGLLRL